MANVQVKSTLTFTFFIALLAVIYLASADPTPYHLSKVGSYASSTYRIVHNFGSRVKADYSVYNETVNRKYGYITNASALLGYPKVFGKNVTFVQVVVQQSSKLNNAYIYSGGIGQNFISINITGINTSFLNTSFYVFGK